jgi:hypothetical protein
LIVADFEDERWNEPPAIGILPNGALLVVNPDDPTPSLPNDDTLTDSKEDRARNFTWEDDDIIILSVNKVDGFFNPNQPRAPKGTETGGQWTGEGFNFVKFAEESAKASLGRELTDKEKDALGTYTSIDYKAINDVLRKSESHGNIELFEKMKTLDDIFNQARLDRDLIVYRAVSKSTLEKMSAAKSFEDRGFVSTTTDIDIAEAFGKETRGRSQFAVVKMRIPKGSRALPISHVSDVPGEREVLVARGSRWNVNHDLKLGRVELTLA